MMERSVRAGKRSWFYAQRETVQQRQNLAQRRRNLIRPGMEVRSIDDEANQFRADAPGQCGQFRHMLDREPT